VVELSQQNTTLEEEALALEQKLGDAEQSVVGLELKVMQLEKQVNSGNTEMSAALEKAQVRR
jgi:phage shock protein A